MLMVQITEKKIDVKDPVFGEKRLFRGKTYLMHDVLAQTIVGKKWGIIRGDDRALPLLSKSALTRNVHQQKLLVIFEGGLGDAISVAVLLILMAKKYNLSIDIACHYHTWRYVFVPMGFRGNRLDFPVEIRRIAKYHYVQPDLTAFILDKTEKWRRCIMEELGSAYGVDMSTFSGTYSIPPHILQRMKLPQKNEIHVGICFESKGKLRSYPDDLALRLLCGLVQMGFEVYHLGTRPNAAVEGLQLRGYYNYLGKTDIFELAALIKQMDFVIGMDSFPVHLSNILGIRTLALLSTTLPGIYRCHKNVRCMQSEIECTPCGEVMDKCPYGYDTCKAFYHPSISPERILGKVICECADLFKFKLKSA